MSARVPGPRLAGARLRLLLGGWFLLVLFLQASCVTGTPPGGLLSGYRSHSFTPPPAPGERVAGAVEPGLESATLYVADFMEPGDVITRPVPIPRSEFQQAVQRLARDVRLGAKTPRQAAHALLHLLPAQPDVPTVAMTGDWEVEQHPGSAPTWTPLRQDGPVVLTPRAEDDLKRKYLQWCEAREGGDCLGLLAGAQFETQGGAAILGRLEATEAALASEGALARAVAAAETVATSSQGPLAVVMFKKRPGEKGETAPGGRSADTVIRHRGGNRQVQLSDGQRWHLPRGKSAADIPAEDSN